MHTQYAVRGWRRFANTEQLSGVLTIVAAAVALAWGAYHFESYTAWRGAIVSVSLHHWVYVWSVRDAVTNLLMPFFFFVVGLELKEANCVGVLSQKGQAWLPFLTAVAGLALPVLVFFMVIFTLGQPQYASGAAIVCATDLALSLAVLRLAGRATMPASSGTFLSAFGIYDDILAIAVLAVFYGQGISWAYVPWLLPWLAVLYAAHRWRVADPLMWIGLCAGTVAMLGMLGLHGSVAGVLAAQAVSIHADSAGHRPLHRVFRAFHKPVMLVVMPLFVWSQAGLPLVMWQQPFYRNALVLAIVLGLVLGKLLGIYGILTLARHRWPHLLPQGFTRHTCIALGLLGGIGFTVSLLVADLAFDTRQDNLHAISGVVVASLLAALLSVLVMRRRKVG